MEILPILHTSGQKQLAFWSLKSTPCRIYGGKKVDMKNTCTQFRFRFGNYFLFDRWYYSKANKNVGHLNFLCFHVLLKSPTCNFVLMCMYCVWLLYIKAWKLERATCQDWLSHAHYAQAWSLFALFQTVYHKKIYLICTMYSVPESLYSFRF